MANHLPRLKQYITLYHGEHCPCLPLIEQFDTVRSHQIREPAEVTDANAVLILDSGMVEATPIEDWAACQDKSTLIICEENTGDGNFIVPTGWPKPFIGKALENAITEITLRLSRRDLRDSLIGESAKTAQLTSIAQDLSAETNLDKLLTKILTEGRHLACCDAASLFLVERGCPDEEDALVFKLTQNDSISFPFEERRFPLNKASISGFVAITGENINIPDVYELENAGRFTFNRSTDTKTGYRTRSMLTIPMCSHQKNGHGPEIIGVLQFLNRKTRHDLRLLGTEITLKETLPFTSDLVDLLLALASQAAIAIENASLISQVRGLFEGFVKASVTAIEQRDPTTSGHSFRVANLTTSLALATPRSGLSRFSGVSFDENSIREIRYASLLHDFGKVGVREHVLVKANKLQDSNLEQIRLRFALFKEQLRAKNAEERLAYVLSHGREAYHRCSHQFMTRLDTELDRFTRFYEQIATANKPTVLSEGSFEHLREIRSLQPMELDGRDISLLGEDEYKALCIRKGSLTALEREEIESHVKHTFNFLSRIPWTPDLRNAPEIAFAHHEKLNGTGYPRGLTRDEIPLPSRMMTVADIYDALTASDRPYKPAVPRDRALAILQAEAKSGNLDDDLVRIFIEAEIYENAEENMDGKFDYTGYTDNFIQRNTCDYDIPFNPWDTAG